VGNGLEVGRICVPVGGSIPRERINMCIGDTFLKCEPVESIVYEIGGCGGRFGLGEELVEKFVIRRFAVPTFLDALQEIAFCVVSAYDDFVVGRPEQGDALSAVGIFAYFDTGRVAAFDGSEEGDGFTLSYFAFALVYCLFRTSCQCKGE